MGIAYPLVSTVKMNPIIAAAGNLQHPIWRYVEFLAIPAIALLNVRAGDALPLMVSWCKRY